MMSAYPTPPNNSRLGFHYFPDTLHYRETDLRAWVPELKKLGASWLVLQATPDRAIPEGFIRGLIEAEIEPVLHFPASTTSPPAPAALTPLLEAFAHWGGHYICLFDRPNLRSSWEANAWARIDLVERFLDLYLPLAQTSVRSGLWPVFPPLEPGGDYWDTAFLRTALHSLKRRRQNAVLDRLSLAAVPSLATRPLDWGAGGPERWPGARPYFTPPGEQDQCGFRIFDWYNTLAQAELSRPLPILLLETGRGPNTAADPKKLLTIAQWMAGEENGRGEPVPPEVQGCMFWLLAATTESGLSGQAWFKPDGTVLPITRALRGWAAGGLPQAASKTLPRGDAAGAGRAPFIRHYLLLPCYEWGVADWHLEVIRPYVKKHSPTVGFSVAEAMHAKKVTIVGGEQSFPAQVLAQLEAAGCQIVHVQGDGMSIATQLASL